MWDPEGRVQRLLSEVGGDDVCPARVLCDRHSPDAVAFTVVAADLSGRDITYGRLRERSELAAAALASLGVCEGDRVATLMGRSEELVVTLLGIWRLGAVHVPLFTAFAPSAIAARLIPSATRVVVCDAGQRGKLDASEAIPSGAPWRVVVAGDPSVARPGDAVLDALLAAQDPGHRAAGRQASDPLVHLFTSGTAGAPKGR